MQGGKIVPISGLRGFSCLIIMLYHYRFFLMNNGIEIISYGHYFVEVFVTISGFLMAYNYRNRVQDMRFKDFFVKRYLKIMPLYWITDICAYVAVILSTVLSGQKYMWNPLQMVLEFSGFYTGWLGQTKTPANSPLWTVCCLLLCYIFYFFICKICKKSKIDYIKLIITMIFISMIFMIWLTDKMNHYLVVGGKESVRCMISFLMGLLLYELYAKMSEQQGKVISHIIIVIFIGIVIFSDNLQGIRGISIEDVISWIVIFLFCPLMLYSAIYVKFITNIFSWRVLQFIGKISMDIYMWHWVVRIYLGSRPFYLDQETLSGWIVLILAALSVSVVSHYIFMPLIYRISEIIKGSLGKQI